MISMKTLRSNMFTFVLALLILAALNFHCWQPGIGSYVEDAHGHVSATELDLYYGWPADYRVESWRSDEDLSHELLAAVPFYTLPDSMELVTRGVGLVAAAVDVVFAVAVLLLLSLYLETEASGRWSPRTMAAAVGLVGVLVACYAVGFYVGAVM